MPVAPSLSMPWGHLMPPTSQNHSGYKASGPVEVVLLCSPA